MSRADEIGPVSWAVALGTIVFAACTLWMMGRVPICECGRVKLWHGVVASSENSQHVSDWYTFSHVIHGFAFYGVYHLLAKRRSLGLGLGLALAVALESGWEIFENTELVIERYREATISLDYYGDSVINSVCDILAMVAGFLLASRWPVALTLGLTVGLELFVLAAIRDNLTLNVIMLVWPLEAIRRWQAGA